MIDHLTVEIRRDANRTIHALTPAQQRWLLERLTYEMPALVLHLAADLVGPSPVAASSPPDDAPDGAGHPPSVSLRGVAG